MSNKNRESGERVTDGFGWMENLLNDCRYAERRLRRSPGFALAAILTLVLGIGPTVAVFTVVIAVLLNPLPGGPNGRDVCSIPNSSPKLSWR